MQNLQKLSPTITKYSLLSSNKAQKSMCVNYSLTVPSIFAANPKVVAFSILYGDSHEIPFLAILLPSHSRIKFFHKIQTFSDLPTLFHFSMQ